MKVIAKQFKNLKEQMEILKYKGLVISDENYTKEVLLRENYFFINGYRHLFFKSDIDKTFIKGTTFEEIYSLFLFDRSFRNILFKNLLIIENNLKSIISYQLSRKYGYKEKDYLNAKNFTTNPENTRRVNDLIRKMKRQIRINGSQHTATQHYVSHYGYIPLWILVKVLSFGIVSELFAVLKKEDQEDIADSYSIDRTIMLLYLPMLANYRNLCAHEDIVYENRTRREINDTVYHQLLNIPKEHGQYTKGKNDVFALVIMMKQLLTVDDFNTMMSEIERNIDSLYYNLKAINIEIVLDRMGFPINWKDLKNMKRSKNQYEN